MKTLRVGLIGCGKVVQTKHLTALNRLKTAGLAELVAVCDSQFELAQTFCKPLGLPAYENLDKMLAQEKLDLAIIATPSGTHAKLGMQVAEKGVDVVIEKPLALTLADADQLIECCNQNQVRLFEIKQYRFNRAVVKTKEALRAERLGKITTASAHVLWRRDQAYYDSAAWRGTWEMDGGVFANQAIHHLDLLVWLLGPVESVMAKGGTLLLNMEAEDTGVALIKFVSGTLAVVQASVCVRPKDQEGSLDIFGERGTVRLGGFSADQMKVWEFVEPIQQDQEILTHWNVNPTRIPAYAHYECLKDIVTAIHENRPAVIDGVEARKSLELLNAIYESMENGHEIYLTFKPTRSKLGNRPA